jgi:hypothetical protein
MTTIIRSSSHPSVRSGRCSALDPSYMLLPRQLRVTMRVTLPSGTGANIRIDLDPRVDAVECSWSTAEPRTGVGPLSRRGGWERLTNQLEERTCGAH